MANPQKENGHIDIANEIAEALARTNFNKYESRYLWVLWRKTYGWHKKEDYISNSQFSDATGIKRPHIWRTEQSLIKRNIVTKLGNKTGFNKDYTQWRELPKQVTVTKLGTTVTNLGTKKLPKQVHTKENNTKETNTKEREVNTHKEEIIQFFEKGDKYTEMLDVFSKDKDRGLLESEFDKFILYWSESNGLKQRWQLQEVFDVKRRLFTWLSKINSFTNKQVTRSRGLIT